MLYLQIVATKMPYLQVFATTITFLKCMTKTQCLALGLELFYWNPDKYYFATKQHMFGVFTINEILRYRRTLWHPVLSYYCEPPPPVLKKKTFPFSAHLPDYVDFRL